MTEYRKHTMASEQSPSKLQADLAKTAEQLRALELQKKQDIMDGYVCVNYCLPTPITTLKTREQETVSVALMGKWQDTLLADPKNR